MENPKGLPGQLNLLVSAEKPIHIGDYQRREEPSIEDKNNMEVSGTPMMQVRLESNDISAADQTVPSSIQLNDIEAKCKYQKTLETVLKAAPAQELFERKLGETWKQECTTYDDLNRNIPRYKDQSQNFADSGFVKVILQQSRKKLNAALDIRGMTDSENSINAGSLDPEIQQGLDENYSPPAPDVIVVSMEDHKGQAVQEQQQKVPSKRSQKVKRKQQLGLKEPKQQPKKLCSSSVMKKNKKRRQKKRHGSSRLRCRCASTRTRGSRCTKQATKPKERGTSLHRKEQGHVSDSGFENEPNDAESSTPWQRDSCSPTKQGNSSSSGDGNNDKGGGRVSRNGGVGGGTGGKNDDGGEEPPPGKDGESHIDITAVEWQRKLARVRERQNAGYLNLRAPLHQSNMPPEVLRDETGDQAPLDFNLKPPPDSNKLSLSANTSGFSGNAETSGAVMQSDPMLLHERVRNDSGFLSGPSPQVPTQPLKLLNHDIPRKKPVLIARPEPSRFHPTVAESNGVIPREPEGAVGDQGAVTADTTFDPAFQKLARPPLLPRFQDEENTHTLYNNLDYFDFKNQAQDNVLGSPYTHFVSTVEQEQHLGRHIPRSREDQHHVHPAVDYEGLLEHPSEESTPCMDRVEMVGCVTPFLPPDVVCSLPSAREPANGMEPANVPIALLHANFESCIVGILSSPDLWTFTPQSDMYVPSVEPQTLVN